AEGGSHCHDRFQSVRPFCDILRRNRLKYAACRGEERRTGMRCREIKQSVIRARWIADIHALEHLLDHPEISRIADEIGSEFPVTWASEGHVVTKDIMLSSVCADDGG